MDPAWGVLRLEAAYIDDTAGAESSPSVKPVIVFELVDFHSLLLAWRRHHQRHGWSLGSEGLYWTFKLGKEDSTPRQ